MEVQILRMWMATLQSTNKASRMLVVLGMLFTCKIAIAQQYTHGDCSPNVNGVGGNVNITCNPRQQDPFVSEEQRWENRRHLEEEKLKYRKANGGCELGFHRVCWTANASRTGEFLGNLGCHCEAN
jgi:hypothetical protein